MKRNTQQKLVGPEVSISSMQISRCTALLDTGLQAWRTRPLGMRHRT
ncbi:Mobile element protein [Polaromonas sp. CG9_12]|nr:Mobile element protein [Polaromonas sp. CG9_12]